MSNRGIDPQKVIEVLGKDLAKALIENAMTRVALDDAEQEIADLKIEAATAKDATAKDSTT